MKRGGWLVASIFPMFALTMSSAAMGTEKANSLDLEQVLTSVDRTFPLLAATRREQDEAEGNLQSARGGFDTSLKASGTYEPVSGYPKRFATVQAEQPTTLWGASVFAGYRFGDGKIPLYEGKIETNDFGELRGGVRVPLWRDGWIDRRRASLKQAELGVEIAKLSVDQQRIEARRAATLRYWDWVAAGRRLAILKGWMNLAVERDTGLAVRAERGDIPEIDRTENQRTILQRQTAVIGGERDVAQAAMELSLFLRTADGAAMAPSSDRLPSSLPEPVAIDVPNANAEQDSALLRRPDLKRLERVKERSQIEADFAKNQQKPAIDLTLYGARQFGPGEEARGAPVAGAAVVVDIPLQNRVQTGREDSALATIAKTQEQQRFTRDRIAADVRSALVAIDASRDRAHMAKREVAVATELAKAELRRFELGEGNLLLVNLREQANLEAAIREVDALADFQRAIANYRAATAKDLPR